jgi:hypothetical protein
MRPNGISLAVVFLALTWMAAGFGLVRLVNAEPWGVGPGAFMCASGLCFGAGVGTIFKRPILGAAIGLAVMVFFAGVMEPVHER